MSNTIVIGLNDRNKKKPLRGDCQGANLDYIPLDNKFKVTFYTEDAQQYTLNSTNKFFINGAVANSITLGGRANLSIELMYDPSRSIWVVTDHNLNAGTGGGGIGVTPNITAVAVTLPAGSAATVTKTGTLTEPVLTFGIPRGPKGDAGTGTGNAVSPAEVPLVPVNGAVTIDAAVSSRYVLDLAGSLLLNDPINVTETTGPFVIVTRVTQANYNLRWGPNWAFSDSQPPGLGSAVGAINLIEVTPTYIMGANPMYIAKTFPDKSVLAGFGTIRPIARVSSLEYFMLANATGTGAFNNLVSGGTLAQNTIHILRSGKAAEATGTITDTINGQFLIVGDAQPGQADPRPLLQMLKTDYSEGPPRGANRPSFGKQVLGVEGYPTNGGTGITLEIRDLRITGGRNDDGDCRGIGQNGQAALTIKNVHIFDNNNGILTDNATNTPLTVIDCLVDANGVGTPNNNPNQGNNSTGYVHNIYTGHNDQTFTALRSSFTNSLTGHDIKTRCAATILDQVYAGGSVTGRELDVPNGGVVRATNCIFEKFGNATQNNLIAIGNTFDAGLHSQEGIDTSRPREYIFRNCRFINPISGTRDTSFLATKDRDVAVQFIDCEFIGAETLAKTTTGPFNTDPNYAGMQMTKGVYHMPGKPPVWTLTGGPVGPALPVGKPSNVAMTPVA